MWAKTRLLGLANIGFNEVLRCQITHSGVRPKNDKSKTPKHFRKALDDAEIAQIFEGRVENLAVRVQGKLTTTWGHIEVHANRTTKNLHPP